MATPSSRKTILALALHESAKVLAEQEEAMAAPAPATPPPPPAAPAPEANGTEPLTLDALLDRLNTIRSGKSFTDPTVYAKLSSWFRGMDAQTQATLNDNLVAISAIVQNQAFEPAAPAAPAPATPPAPAAPAPPAPAV